MQSPVQFLVLVFVLAVIVIVDQLAFEENITFLYQDFIGLKLIKVKVRVCSFGVVPFQG